VREGWRVNRKRVQRLWRAEGLKVVRRQRKRRRLGSSENGCVRHRAEYKNHVWSYDFTLDQTADGKRLKLMPVVDEFTRECHTIEVERSITAEEVIATLSYLFRVHGEPEYIRSDNGPEFIAKAVREWLAASGVKTLYIEPGSPWENAFLESFNGKLEDELLGREIFTSLLEAKVVIEQYRVAYNHERPHSSLGYQTPVEFAATCRTREAAGADEQSLPRPSFPPAAAGSCTQVLSSQRVGNSLTSRLP
jgi:putative transposase